MSPCVCHTLIVIVPPLPLHHEHSLVQLLLAHSAPCNNSQHPVVDSENICYLEIKFSFNKILTLSLYRAFMAICV